MEGLRRNFF